MTPPPPHPIVIYQVIFLVSWFSVQCLTPMLTSSVKRHYFYGPRLLPPILLQVVLPEARGSPLLMLLLLSLHYHERGRLSIFLSYSPPLLLMVSPLDVTLKKPELSNNFNHLP
ncbi:hypothetical protein GDO81_012408 [Engystomops pustulosus]|uniref:Uncharacterized protein n=1 Tax=Engystomops pustulosus TaxID=76066 RepID=A0AAV7BM37_ENGPU|nr:hypothetical protein GDO81_012408 [Engystomops pustulosus]